MNALSHGWLRSMTCACPYTSVSLLVISACVYCKVLLSLSRSRQCGGKAGCSSPQTLAGVRRFHSPCRRCAGSAGAQEGQHWTTGCSRTQLISTKHGKSLQQRFHQATSEIVSRHFHVYLLIGYSHIGTAHRWGRHPAWLPRGCPECLHWLRAQAAASPALLSSDLGSNNR